MNKQEIISETKAIFNNVIEVDNFILEMSKRLNIVLINLLIEEAHITQKTGITPICTEINTIIAGIEEKVKGLVSDNRYKLKGLYQALEENLV